MMANVLKPVIVNIFISMAITISVSAISCMKVNRIEISTPSILNKCLQERKYGHRWIKMYSNHSNETFYQSQYQFIINGITIISKIVE